MTRLAVFLGCIFACAGIASAETGTHIYTFSDPIDAVSFGALSENSDLEVRGKMESGWTTWQRLTLEDEQDPSLTESNLVMFPQAVGTIEVRGGTLRYTVHPVRVSDAPARYLTAAAAADSTEPHILTRSEWGADDSLLFTVPKTTRSDESASDASQTANGDVATPKRLTDCEEAQRLYPSEFRPDNRVTRDAQGRTYRWPLSYSPRVRLLVVHHTAMKVSGDMRSGVERVRALYEYHTNSRGWGDIGYHYLVDETGRIYEGKAGGPMVVGGHAYCNNVGSIGIAMLGNFDLEKPTQEQVRAVQWLLRHLAEVYDMPLDRSVRFHGEIMSPIVGHRDLLSTDCPGHYTYGVLDQIRTHVKENTLLASVTFPEPRPTAAYIDRAAERKAQRIGSPSPPAAAVKQGLAPMGSQDISGQPNGQMAFSMSFAAGNKSWKTNANIGVVSRSDEAIGLWQEKNGTFVRIRSALTLPSGLRTGDTAMIRFKIQFPPEAGDYSVHIDKWTYTLHVSGRRARVRGSSPLTMTSARSTPKPVKISNSSSNLPHLRISSASSVASKPSVAGVQEPRRREHTIRIRLSYPDSSARIITNSSAITLTIKNGVCASDQMTADSSGVIRIDAKENAATIASWNKPTNQFRGVLECRVINGKLILINELPLETYLKGLAEESDTEPLEKQKAFA
ncbi:N-acetylmuramoyl-L-alanine amidase, partial [Candidatus Peregrinibacteria bacterium]|nr:N-acetylmuramoyl-L-alanine amidase [Candidatus Peregrinibacteria bacterium]